MKIFISNEGLDGHFNLKSVTDLNIVNDCEAEEILIPFGWNSIPIQSIGEIMQLIFRKLKVGGILKIGGYDIIEFSKAVLFESMAFEDRINLVAGSQNFMALDEVTKVIENNFKILNRSLNHIHFMVEAQKL